MKTTLKLLAALCFVASLHADPIVLDGEPSPQIIRATSTLTPEQTTAALTALTTGTSALLTLPEGATLRSLNVVISAGGAARINAVLVPTE